jgi:hypothetical protein
MRGGNIMRRLLREIVPTHSVTGDVTTLEELSVVTNLAAQQDDGNPVSIWGPTSETPETLISGVPGSGILPFSKHVERQRIGEVEPGDSGEPDAWNPFKVTPVAGQQRAAVACHNACDQTVGHSDGIARSFEVPADLTGSIRGRVVQRQGRHSIEQLKQAGKLPRVLRTREEFKPADDGRSECAAAQQPFDRVGFAFAREVVDEDIRIGDGHRQLARILRARVNKPSASFSLTEPFSARAL